MSEFLLNRWYMAAWSNEVGEGLFARRLLDLPVVMFRKSDGTVAALHDRCPHRFAYLSVGLKKGDTVECGYHGLQFDAAGECVKSPYSDAPPKGARVRSFPVAERDGLIWFWPGDPALADPADAPDFSRVQPLPGRGFIQQSFHVNANYQLVVDNLLDISHAGFLHKNTLGRGSDALRDGFLGGQLQPAREGESIWMRWWMPGWTGYVNDPAHEGQAVDRWLDIRWDAPGSIRFYIGQTLSGAPREAGNEICQLHIQTPETATSTHYFAGESRPILRPGDEDDGAREKFLRTVGEVEDFPMLEGIQRQMGEADLWSLQPALLAVDAGAVMARRFLGKLIAAEREGVAQPEPAQA